MDTRLKRLSYSSQQLLHKCPRKFQLYRLNAQGEDEDFSSSVTFAFGHCVGLGIQLAMQDKTEEEIIFELFLMWKPDLFADNPKQNKSFWTAVFAVQKFISLRNAGLLSEYELVYYDDKPACELSFRIDLIDGFTFRGYVDIVLRNKDTGEFMILELKTTSSKTVQAATYKNSSQALGYSVVLDFLEENCSSYRVLYLVYSSTAMEYTPFEFVKKYSQRAQWLQELLLLVEVISLYDRYDTFPLIGGSCLDYNRECEYYGVCTMTTERLIKPYRPEDDKEEEFQFNIDIHQLIAAQMRLASPVVKRDPQFPEDNMLGEDDGEAL